MKHFVHTCFTNSALFCSDEKQSVKFTRSINLQQNTNWCHMAHSSRSAELQLSGAKHYSACWILSPAWSCTSLASGPSGLELPASWPLGQMVEREWYGSQKRLVLETAVQGADAGRNSPSIEQKCVTGKLGTTTQPLEKYVQWLSAAYLRLHWPLLHLVLVCTAVSGFWNELSVYKLWQKNRGNRIPQIRFNLKKKTFTIRKLKKKKRFAKIKQL